MLFTRRDFSTTDHHRNNFAPKIYALLALLVTIGAVLLFGNHTDGSAQSLEKLNRFVQGTKAADAAMTVFRQGRDLIEDGSYDEAADKFKRFMAENPRHRDIDAALYWLAFSLKKVERYRDADRQLERLLREYPKSNWIDDARAMRVEIAGQLKDTKVIGDELDKSNNEIKRIALQSLFQADPERAAALVADLLKPDSKADHKLKETAVALLGQMGGGKGTAMLINLTRDQKDQQLRKTAIFWLGQSDQTEAFNVLQETTKSDDEVIAKAALFALSQHHDKRGQAVLLDVAMNSKSQKLRKQAIFWLGQRGDDSTVDDLMKIYSSEQSVEIKKQILFALSQHHSQRARAVLYETARTGAEPELRKQAIFWLGQQGDDQTLELLIQLYDAEKDHEVKDKLIFAFSQSGKKPALRKLLQIAKSDSQVEMRKKAIFWLGQSSDPEATRFLEEIIR